MPEPPQTQYATYPSLQDRVVVITGGATGIGAAMVTAFARQGAKTIVLDIDRDALSELARSLAGEAGVSHGPETYLCDLTDIEGSVKPVASRILSRDPCVHALINNAGNDARMATPDITVRDWDDSLAVNLRHVFFLTQALMPGLREAGDRAAVVNLSSITWAIPAVGQVPYVASKAGIVGLTRTLAHEFGPVSGIRVNSIMPGAIQTERQTRDVLTPEYREGMLGRQALKRILQPEEVARLALWLCADDSSGVTNQSLVVDAGFI